MGAVRRVVVEPQRERRTVAYLRVSTDGQDLEKNKADILYLANERNGAGGVRRGEGERKDLMERAEDQIYH